MRLDPLPEQLLTMLCWRCRCATERQLVAASGAPIRAVQAAVRALHKKRLVSRERQPVIRFHLTMPLLSSAQSGNQVDFGRLAWQLAQRWQNAPRTTASVVWATRRATQIVGGVSGRLRQPLQLQHDLGLSEVLACRATPEGETWIGEDAWRAFWPLGMQTKLPDAVLLDSQQRVVRVIEFAGRYSRQRLARFHRYWIRQRTPYEIW